MVIAVHTSQYGSNSYSSFITSLLNNGARGVQLFFIASAFTLFLSGGNRKNERNPRINFFIRRFFRIAPLYYLGVLYYLWQYSEEKLFSSGNIASNYLFLHGFNPYWFNSLVPGGWSIAVEMMFYAIVPLLLKYITSVNKAVTFLIASIIFNYIVTGLIFSLDTGIPATIMGDYLYL